MSTMLPKGGKAVFIDGESFHHMCMRSGVPAVAAEAMYFGLLRHVGKPQYFSQRPVTTLLPRRASGAVGDRYLEAGFDVIPCESVREQDDSALRSRIARVDPGIIATIVLVSTDGGFVNTLLTKRRQGIRIVVGISDVVGSDGHAPVGALLRRYLQKEFEGADLSRLIQAWDLEKHPPNRRPIQSRWRRAVS